MLLTVGAPVGGAAAVEGLRAALAEHVDIPVRRVVLAAEPASSTEFRVTIFDEATSAASAHSLVNLLLAELEFAQATSKTMSLGGYTVVAAARIAQPPPPPPS